MAMLIYLMFRSDTKLYLNLMLIFICKRFKKNKILHKACSIFHFLPSLFSDFGGLWPFRVRSQFSEVFLIPSKSPLRIESNNQGAAKNCSRSTLIFQWSKISQKFSFIFRKPFKFSSGYLLQNLQLSCSRDSEKTKCS